MYQLRSRELRMENTRPQNVPWAGTTNHSFDGTRPSPRLHGIRRDRRRSASEEKEISTVSEVCGRVRGVMAVMQAA